MAQGLRYNPPLFVRYFLATLHTRLVQHNYSFIKQQGPEVLPDSEERVMSVKV